MSGVTNKFNDMQDHPENYSDEHIESMMSYIDKPVDVEEKWKKFEAKHFVENTSLSANTSATVKIRKTHLWRNVAAIVVAVFLVAGGTFATKGTFSRILVDVTVHVKEIEPYAFYKYKLPAITGPQYAEVFGYDVEDSVLAKQNEDIMTNYKMFHEVYNPGCSWYCGCSRKETRASSSLQENGAISCAPENITDFNLHTAWVEGAEGQGIGESLEIVFDKMSAPFNEIHIINGYAKKQRIWEENSRVKELKVYYNDTPVCILKLKDTRDEQLFKTDMIGPKDPQNNKKDWVVRFEIRDVYPGTKYEDTAITEILFDGPNH